MQASFSCTAPQVTEQEERQEIAALCQREQIELHKDLWGSEPCHDRDGEGQGGQPLKRKQPEKKPPPNSTTRTTHGTPTAESVMSLFREALQALPHQAKREYMEAVKWAPVVVERETVGVKFRLLGSNSSEPTNMVSAAKSLCAQYRVRKKIFGSSFWLPMTLSGAMSDIAGIVAQGFVQLLPPDQHGRPVVFVDHVRCRRTVCSHENLVRSTGMESGPRLFR